MPRYLSAARMTRAVRSLGASNAQKRLCEYLIVKRVAVINAATVARFKQDGHDKSAPIPKNEGYVTLSTQNRDLVRAIDDLMRWNVGDSQLSEDTETPFLNVFGTAEHEDRGYRSLKYLSNGVSDTIANWKKYIEFAEDAKPREFRVREVSPALLSSFMLKAKGKRPRLEDAAAWYFRGRDIEPLVKPTYAATMDALVAELMRDVGLSEAEADALFDRTISEEEAT